MRPEPLLEAVLTALDDQKADHVTSLDVRSLTTITDYMVVASGTSSRHVQAIAENLQKTLKSQGVKPAGYEGDPSGDWMLVDFGDVVVHIMHPRTRDFYNLEKLWSAPVVDTPQASSSAAV